MITKAKKAREMTDEEFDKCLEDGLHHCQKCDTFHDYLHEVFDNYGNFYKKACDNCFDKVEKEISKFVFDEGYAGERMYEDY